jgi:hypothetical protein
MMDGPCAGWAPDTTVCPTWATFDAPSQSYALEVAIYVIWAATGRRFESCSVTVRPCWSPAAPLYQTYPSAYYWGLAGESLGDVGIGVLSGCACGSVCACTPSEVRLAGPVISVDEVKIDGVVLDPSAYRLDSGVLLVRQDGQAWPMVQNMSLPAGEPDTWTVRYSQGQQVTALLNKLAGRYACEVVKGMAGQDCALPKRATSISRRGVDVQLIDKDSWLEKGLTGIAALDTVITAINPDHLSSRPRVLSPDLPRPR